MRKGVVGVSLITVISVIVIIGMAAFLCDVVGILCFAAEPEPYDPSEDLQQMQEQLTEMQEAMVEG